ncbi:DUF3017 domain-containing protein [Streptomyces sp. NPDC090306]|uniref:DUF3017 domain-containing protein n=1 Tax=Streptomyces sp. NPDC090306 TaxID=3365961 RepID=UPI003810596F
MTTGATDAPRAGAPKADAAGSAAAESAPAESATAAGPGSESGSGADSDSGPESESRSRQGSGSASAGSKSPAAEAGSVAGDTGDIGGDGVEADAEPEIEVRDAVSAPDAQGRPRRATRRFPLFTRDTARPEGGGRAAPSDAPAPARQWPVLMVLGVVALGLLLTALDLFRIGTMLIGLALLVGAVMRWVVPDVGMLAVRSRFTDIVTYGVLGFAIVLLAMMVQPRPWLEIPVLDDALHFTIRT